MKFISFCICLLLLNASCSSQANYANKAKLKLNDNLFVVKTTDGYDAIDAKNNFLFPLAYDNIMPFEKQLFKFFKVQKGEHYGLIDYNGIEMIETDFDDLEIMNNKSTGENILKMNANGKWGVMLFPGKLVTLAFAYDELGDFGDSDRLLLVKKDGKYGYKDLGIVKHGDRSTRVEYDYLENYKTEGSKYEKNGEKGTIVLSKITGYLMEFPEGSVVKNDPAPKFVYSKNKRFEENGKYGLKNKRNSNKIIVPAIYQSLWEREIYDREICIIQKNDKWGVMDSEGKITTPLQYKKIREFVRTKRQNLQAFEENEKVGIMDLYSGKVVLKPEYEDLKFAAPFTNKVIAKADGKWGILSIDGKWLAQNKYDKIDVFTDALSSWITQFAERRYQFKVQIGDQHGIINDSGEVLVEVAYDSGFSTFMLEEYRDYVVVYKDRKAGLCKYGVLKKPNEFFDKIYTASGKLWIEKAGKKAEATISDGNVVSYK